MEKTDNSTLAKNRHFALIILDGWGIGKFAKADAILQAHTPYYDSLLNQYPHAELKTFGQYVGLPEGQMGNSEVGHLNIGAGRIVYQELLKINRSIQNGDFFKNNVLLDALAYAKKQNKPIHLIGLVSDGGVHSHIIHLKALIKLLQDNHCKGYVHAFTDGRDVDPHSAMGFIKKLHQYLNNSSIKLASVIGRYYAMDRDKRWERIQKAYLLLTKGKGSKTNDILQSIQQQYDDGITDEFLEPISVRNPAGQPVGTIQDGDVVLFFNFRTDRPRQLTEALSQRAIKSANLKPLSLYFVTMTPYDQYDNVRIIFEKEQPINTLGEVLATKKMSQLRIAETEKYAHVTYFFNGGREAQFKGEKRIMVPSPKVATYDLKPDMSANEVCSKAIEYSKSYKPNFICLNFANTDMVGHTGVFEAAKQAAQTVDQCLSDLVPHLLNLGYELIITADHGNADLMFEPDGRPHTAHTTNPVPIIFVSPEAQKYTLTHGRLCDLAPTILDRMHINIPKEMTGKILIQKI